jgi:hypothetical protein
MHALLSPRKNDWLRKALTACVVLCGLALGLIELLALQRSRWQQLRRR